MLAVQSPPSTSALFNLPKVSSPATMTAPLPNGGNQATSVFNALGSWADRIKDGNGRASSSQTSNGTIPHSTATSSSVSPSPTPAMGRPVSGRAQAPNPSTAPAKTEGDGQWETVQSSRNRAKPKEEEQPRGSSSRDWRERPATKERSEEPERTLANTKPAKKAMSVPTSTSVPASNRSSAPQSSTKSAWAVVPPVPAQQAIPSSSASTHIPTAKANVSHEVSHGVAETPPSPSINETSTTIPSIGSPNLTAETGSSSTAPTSIARADVEEDWRVKQKDNEMQSVPAPAPAPRQVALPPAINAWDLRKRASASNAPSAPASAPVNAEAEVAEGKTTPLQFGTVTPQESTSPLPNGNDTGESVVKIVKKKKKGAETSVPPVMDANAFPDLAKAVEATKAAEEKKEHPKTKKETEEAGVVEDSTTSSRKTKWTAIPASELLAAADEAAEASRRQSREAAARKKAAKRAESTSTSPVKGRRKESTEVRRGRSTREASGEIRLPPQPNGSRGSSSGFKPVFGSLQLGTDGQGDEGHEFKAEPMPNGGFSAPLSRQTSRQSRRSSPLRSRTQASSPTSQPVALDGSSMRFGTGPYSGRPSNTAPFPQQSFTGASNLPRPLRGREARGSFSYGRGRGGFRGGAMGKGNNGAPWSPTGGAAGLPDMPYPNGNAFQRGHSLGYPQMYSMAPGYGPMVDPMQGYITMGVYGRGGPPPPPMPHTVVPNLDSLRFYVLGQVEYYFSMQNLAMDFFLRQQMDSEGWIDIAMIASFNRIKSLTPDVPTVCEVMLLSSLLEVREDKVRLAGAEAKRWVLPDAKPSPWAADATSPTSSSSPHLHPHDPVFGVEEFPPAPRFVAADVENALMKSSGVSNVSVSVPPSSSASVTNSGDGVDDSMVKMNTPATSMSGDNEGEEALKIELK